MPAMNYHIIVNVVYMNMDRALIYYDHGKQNLFTYLHMGV